MDNDEKVLLGRVAGGLEALVREQATFREETTTALETIDEKLDKHATELAELRGQRARTTKRTATVATVLAAAIAALGHVVAPFAKAIASSLATK